ncbi:MAG: hypothetical protein IK020_07880 [Clostridiales bacterium]|nr:hypothetical protein [Clostridiales bacterium]
MKKSALRLAAIVLSLSILAGCSSAEETTKKKKSKKTDEATETEETEDPSDDSSENKDAESSETTADTSATEETSAVVSTEESTTSATEDTIASSSEDIPASSSDESSDVEDGIKNEWLVDDSYFQAAQTGEGKTNFGAYPQCPSFENVYNRFSTQEYQEKFDIVDTMTLDDYYFFEEITAEYGDTVDGFVSVSIEPKDADSPLKSINVMIYEELPFDAPTTTYVIFELKDGVTEEDVFKREFQEMIYPHVVTIFGKDIADIMVYSSEESLGYMRRVMSIDGYARAPEYRIKRLINHVYLEFYISESTSDYDDKTDHWEDYTPPTT